MWAAVTGLRSLAVVFSLSRVAANAKAWEKVAVGKNRHYVLEAATQDPFGEWVDRGPVDPALDSYAIDGSPNAGGCRARTS